MGDSSLRGWLAPDGQVQWSKRKPDGQFIPLFKEALPDPQKLIEKLKKSVEKEDAEDAKVSQMRKGLKDQIKKLQADLGTKKDKKRHRGVKKTTTTDAGSTTTTTTTTTTTSDTDTNNKRAR